MKADLSIDSKNQLHVSKKDDVTDKIIEIMVASLPSNHKFAGQTRKGRKAFYPQPCCYAIYCSEPLTSTFYAM